MARLSKAEAFVKEGVKAVDLPMMRSSGRLDLRGRYGEAKCFWACDNLFSLRNIRGKLPVRRPFFAPILALFACFRREACIIHCITRGASQYTTNPTGQVNRGCRSSA
jgi:hypothetical protein